MCYGRSTFVLQHSGTHQKKELVLISTALSEHLVDEKFQSASMESLLKTTGKVNCGVRGCTGPSCISNLNFEALL